MSFVSRIRQAFAPKEKSVGAALPAMGYLPTLGSTPSTTGLNISQGTAMAVSTVYACVTSARRIPRAARRACLGAGPTALACRTSRIRYARSFAGRTGFRPGLSLWSK